MHLITYDDGNNASACIYKRTSAEYELPSRPMHVVFLPDRYRAPKLRSFIDFVTERFIDTAV